MSEKLLDELWDYALEEWESRGHEKHKKYRPLDMGKVDFNLHISTSNSQMVVLTIGHSTKYNQHSCWECSCWSNWGEFLDLSILEDIDPVYKLRTETFVFDASGDDELNELPLTFAKNLSREELLIKFHEMINIGFDFIEKYK